MSPQPLPQPPMLARTYDPATPLRFPVWVQPKLDGIRCLATRSGLFSRNLKPLHVPHIEAALEDVPIPQGLVLDGELYCHGESFQTIAGWVKNQSNPHPDSRRINFVVYDVQKALGYEQRTDALETFLGTTPYLCISAIPSLVANNEAQVEALHKSYVSEGYEGSMIRLPGYPYESGKRSKSLLKRKDFLEEDFRILEVLEGEGKNAGTAVFFCSTNGRPPDTFTVTAPGTYAEKAAIFKDREKYLGKYLTVKYQNLTDEGIPRFPIAIGIKEDR